MAVRNRSTLALGLACLLSAGVLGGVLVHDGEVGTDEALLDQVERGDEVRLKGALVRIADVAPGNHTYRLDTGDAATRVLVRADVAVPDGTYVVEGRVSSVGEPAVGQPRAVVVEASSISEPILFG